MPLPRPWSCVSPSLSLAVFLQQRFVCLWRREQHSHPAGAGEVVGVETSCSPVGTCDSVGLPNGSMAGARDAGRPFDGEKVNLVREAVSFVLPHSHCTVHPLCDPTHVSRRRPSDPLGPHRAGLRPQASPSTPHSAAAHFQSRFFLVSSHAPALPDQRGHTTSHLTYPPMQHAGLLLAANSTTAIPLGATTTACLFHTTELAPPNTDTCDLPRPVRCQSLHYSSDKRFTGRYHDVPLLDPAAVSNWVVRWWYFAHCTDSREHARRPTMSNAKPMQPPRRR